MTSNIILTSKVGVLIRNYLCSNHLLQKTDGLRSFRLSLFALLLMFVSPASGQNQPVIIVHPASPLTEIEKDDLLRIFRLSKTTWADGSRIKSVNLKVGNSVRESFFSELLGEDSKKMEALYRKKRAGAAVSRRKTPGLMGRTVKRGGYTGMTGRNKKEGGYNQRRYETKSVYTPKTFATEKDVLKFVSENRGSIGYVLHPDKSVRVLSVKGVSVDKRGGVIPGSSPTPVKVSAKPPKPVVKPVKLPVSVKGEFLIIVHPENPRKKITKEELVNIFKVRKTRWKDGTDIKSVNLKAEHPVRGKFSSKVLSKAPKEMDTFYRKRLKKLSSKPVAGVLGRKEKKGGYSALTGKGQKRGAYDERRYERKYPRGPSSFKTEKEILKFVAENKGSIGYVSSAGPSVKVLKVLGFPLKKKEKKRLSADISKPKPVSVKKTVTGVTPRVVSKPVPKPKPKPAPKPVPKPLPKPAPKVLAKIAPVALSSASGQTFNINYSGPMAAADITIKGPAFEAGRKGPVRATHEIRIHIPENLRMEWDESVSFLKISGSAKKSLRRWVTYSKDRKTLHIPVVEDFQSGGSVVLSGMKFSNIKQLSPEGGFLWLEVANNGTRESVDDKPIMIKEGATHLVISAPLNKIPPVGGRVEALLPKTEVAGNSFELEIYLVDDRNRRVGKGRSIFLKDSWVSPLKPVSKKHISFTPEKVTLKQGYARVYVTYPEAGTINIVAGEVKKQPPYATLRVIFRPAYLALKAAACGTAGEPMPVIVEAVNAKGAVTENYEGSVLLRSRLAYGISGVSVTRPEDRSIPVSGGKTEVQYVYPDAGALLFSATGAYLKNEFIETKNQKVVCFRPSTFSVTVVKSAPDRDFFYSSPAGCSLHDYVNVTVEAVNSAGMVTRNFLGDMVLETAGGESLVLPATRTFTGDEKGLKKIVNTIYSKKEQSLSIKATGTMKEGLCQCDSFSGVSARIKFRQGNILVTQKTGIAGGLTRKRTGKIVQVSRATSSDRLSVPVTLRFNNGEIIKEDNSTHVSLKIESETGMVRNSASIEGNNSFKALKGKGVFLLTDSEGESVTVTASSNPCLASEKGKISFSEDKVVILTYSGHFHEEVDVRIEVHDKSGKITKKYDGTVIEGLVFKPEREYIVTPSEKTVIKGGIGIIKVKNNNPDTGKMEIFVVKPLIKGAALIVKPEKIRFRGKAEKAKSSFSDLIGKKIKGILGK